MSTNKECILLHRCVLDVWKAGFHRINLDVNKFDACVDKYTADVMGGHFDDLGNVFELKEIEM